MATPNSISLLLWLGGAILAAGIAILVGHWVYGITTADDLPVLLLVGILAIPAGLAVLLLSAIRDRLAQRKQENFLEVDY